MTLIAGQGFDITTTITHYTLGIGWDADNSFNGNSPSSAASRNATGNGLLLTTSSARMAWVIEESLRDDLLILGVAYKPISFYTTAGHMNVILSLYSDSTTRLHVLLGHDNTGKIQVKKDNTNGTLLGEEVGNTFSLLNIYHYVEMKVRLDDTNGSVEVRVDGSTAPVINVTGVDTKTALATDTTFGTVMLRGSFSTSVAGTGHFDDFYLCNEQGSMNNDFLGDVVIQPLSPNGNGTTSELTGSDGNSVDNYLLVDESPANTSDYVGSATDNLRDTYAFSNVSGTPTTIRGVAIYAFASKSDAGAKSLALVTRSGGTEAQTADEALSLTWRYFQHLYETDPTDSAVWTQTKVDNAEFGVKVRP